MARKPNKINARDLEALKKNVLQKSGMTIRYPKDCKGLAGEIYNVTNKYISESTLKRFLGFHDSGFFPSYETIHILEQYVKNKGDSEINADTAIRLILDFFEPVHFGQIDNADVGFQAACRRIALTLKKNPALFERVYRQLAKNEMGRRFYFDLFPDYEMLSSFQYKGYELYLKYDNTYEGKMFARCLLFLKSFFINDDQGMKHWLQEINATYQPETTLHPYVLGRVYQVKLIGSYFFNKKEIRPVIKTVFRLEKIQPRNKRNLAWEFPGFHYFACDGLWHVGEWEALRQLSEIALNEFDRFTEFGWNGYYGHLYLYNALALAKLGRIKEAEKNMKYINPDRFYFISKDYFTRLYNILKKTISN